MAKDKVAAFVEESKADTIPTPNAAAVQNTPALAPTVAQGGKQVGSAVHISPAQAAKQAAAQQKAQQKAQQQAQRTAIAQQKAAKAAQKTAVKQAVGITSAVVDINSAVSEPVANATENVGDWIASRPAPGGLFVLLLVIFVFLWLIVPVNGTYTRAQLLWKTLVEERTTIKGSTATDTTGFAVTQESLPSSAASSSTAPSTVYDFGGGYAGGYAV